MLVQGPSFFPYQSKNRKISALLMCQFVARKGFLNLVMEQKQKAETENKNRKTQKTEKIIILLLFQPKQFMAWREMRIPIDLLKKFLN